MWQKYYIVKGKIYMSGDDLHKITQQVLLAGAQKLGDVKYPQALLRLYLFMDMNQPEPDGGLMHRLDLEEKFPQGIPSNIIDNAAILAEGGHCCFENNVVTISDAKHPIAFQSANTIHEAITTAVERERNNAVSASSPLLVSGGLASLASLLGRFVQGMKELATNLKGNGPDLP